MRISKTSLTWQLAAIGTSLAFAPLGLAAEDPFKGAGNVVLALEKMEWTPQAPGLPQKVVTLWGNRDRDGGFGQLIELPPGFKSPLHAHSGDFHGVLIKGTWLHEDANGKGVPAQPGSYVRQAGGEITSIDVSATNPVCYSCFSIREPM